MEKILIVDDEAFIRENLERILAEDGYRPHSTESPEAAVQQVAEEEVEVLLFEPKTVVNTGDQRNERTLDHVERI